MVAEAGGPSTRGRPGRSDRLPWHHDHGQSGAMGWIHSITSCRSCRIPRCTYASRSIENMFYTCSSCLPCIVPGWLGSVLCGR
eukprot:2529018-Alexandrium_andersonii.AAC.1